MQPRIEIIASKKLAGKRMLMSFADNKTADLWRSFMQSRHIITNTVGKELFSMQLYDEMFFSSFDAAKEFEKWAAVEVLDFDSISPEMETTVLPGGMYAVFNYKGSSVNGAAVFKYIFQEWLK